MKQLGYILVASDSHYFNTKYAMPPSLVKHRPDSIGYREEDNSVCIGEAKYYGDLSSQRSKTQIKDFINLSAKSDLKITVVFGIPMSLETEFESLIGRLNIEINERTVILKVPDRLIPSKEDEFDNESS